MTHKNLSLLVSLLFIFSTLSASPPDPEVEDSIVTITDAQIFADGCDTIFQMQFSDGSHWQSWEAFGAVTFEWTSLSSCLVKQHWHVGDRILITSKIQDGYERTKAVKLKACNLDRENVCICIMEGWAT